MLQANSVVIKETVPLIMALLGWNETLHKV